MGEWGLMLRFLEPFVRKRLHYVVFYVWLIGFILCKGRQDSKPLNLVMSVSPVRFWVDEFQYANRFGDCCLCMSRFAKLILYFSWFSKISLLISYQYFLLLIQLNLFTENSTPCAGLNSRRAGFYSRRAYIWRTFIRQPIRRTLHFLSFFLCCIPPGRGGSWLPTTSIICSSGKCLSPYYFPQSQFSQPFIQAR